MFVLIFLLFLSTPLESKGGLFDCTWRNISLSAFSREKLNINHSQTIVVNWDLDKNTDHLLVNYTNDISLTTNISDNGDTIHIAANDKACCSSITNQIAKMLMILPFLLILHFLPSGSKSLVIGVVVFSCIVQSWSTNCTAPTVHIKLPSKYIKTICINHSCKPTTCNLGNSGQSKYSDIDARKRALFADDKCTLRKPDRWDEWISHYYKTNISTERFFYFDGDSDGLVNILEYYSNLNITSRTKRSIKTVHEIGSDPTKADTDGDLLLDGFEYINNLSPTVKGNPQTDSDGDGLTDLDEQIHNTDPLSPDTDGDGVTDQIEIRNNADPNDPLDKGSRQASNVVALVKLTIGDPSGSHSERYTLNVGNGVSHQSPDFGVVGSGVYPFKPGKYTITVQWVASIYSSPDYDYFANVEGVNNDETKVKVTVDDPSRLLGYHYESRYDFSAGKSATLTVQAVCKDSANGEDSKDLACIDSCEECDGKGFWTGSYCSSISLPVVKECPCTRCQKWYDEEKKNTKWLDELNRNVPCPCKAAVRKWGPFSGLKDANPNGFDWDFDLGCRIDCKSDYHPKAYGCMRYTDEKTGARQQCCYNNNLDWIPSGDISAGTPDKSAGLTGHYFDDVQTFSWCCENCKKEGFCDYYIKGVRKGGDTCTN